MPLKVSFEKNQITMFATVSKNDMRKFLNKKDAGYTKKARNLPSNIFTTYLKEKNLNEQSYKDKSAKV